ncbi:MAG: cache domain-containing protein [Granulosicoccus sp.]
MMSTDTLSVPAELHRNNRVAVALMLAMATFAASSITSLLASRWATEQSSLAVSANLSSELEYRKGKLTDYLGDVESNLSNIASSRIAASITLEFVDALKADGDEGYVNMRRAYITENPNPPGRKHALIYANDSSQYSRVHGRYHDWLLSISTAHDYYDLFISDADGNIVYSVFKEDDFGTSLTTGKYRNTALAHSFIRIRDSLIPGEATFSDFSAYAPSDNLPAAFIGVPIMRDGQFAGSFIAQLKQPRLNKLIKADRTGVGKMQVYLAGEDGYMRAGSGMASDEVLEISVDHKAVEAALSNRSGVLDTTGINGRDTVSAYAPLRWKGVTWALIVEIDQNTVEIPVKALRTILAFAALLCTVLAFGVGWLLADRPDEAR